MATNYTSQATMLYDLKLWMAWKYNSAQNLSHFPKIAENKWSWMVYNWNTLKPRFKTFANGDDFLEGSLSQLDIIVRGSISGSTVNPYKSTYFYSLTYEFLELVALSETNLTVSEQTFINNELKRVSEFTEEDFKAMVLYIRTRRDAQLDAVGLGDAYYSAFEERTMGVQQRNYELQDLDLVNQLTNLEDFITGVLLDFKYNKNTEPNLLLFAQNNISTDSQVFFNTAYRSYISIPFEQSLEQMAQDHLGNKSQWYDLVTVNKLKPPYMDIPGTKTYLLESGAGLSVRVPDTYSDRLRIGNKVKLGSRLVPDEIRQIESVTDNKDGTLTLYFSGNADLGKFQTIHQAYVRCYLPETMQEFSFVKIPFNVASSQQKVPNPELQSLKQLDNTLYAFGVDLSINPDTKDLNLGNTGDLKYSYGMDAVRQSVLSRIAIPAGELPMHSDYGFADNTGEILYGGNTIVRFSETVKQELLKDKRYSSVDLSNVLLTEGGGSMIITVTLSGSDQKIPFSYTF